MAFRGRGKALHFVPRVTLGNFCTSLYYDTSDIAKFVIWKAPEELQEEIASLVVQSHEASKKAREFLDRAKRKVAEAIEHEMGR